MGGVGARGRPEAAQQQKQPQASPMRMSLPLTSHGPQIFLSLRAAAALLFSLLSQHGVDPGRVAMARHFHRSTCMSDHHCDHGFGLIDRPRACLPAAASSTLERGCHAQTPVYHHLPLGAAWASSVLPAFVVLLVLGDTIFSPSCYLVILHSFTHFSSGHFTGPQTRISLAIYSHCHLFFHPQSARFRATRLVPYLIPYATAMEKTRERQRATTAADEQRKGRHTARENRALRVLWRCILTTDFPFPSLFFGYQSLSLSSSLNAHYQSLP